MTDKEKVLLRRKWKFQGKLKILVNGMGSIGAMKGILDFSKDGILAINDGTTEFNYKFKDGVIEISSVANLRNTLRLRICELSSDKLIIAISGRKGKDDNDQFGPEIVEIEYAPLLDS